MKKKYVVYFYDVCQDGPFEDETFDCKEDAIAYIESDLWDPDEECFIKEEMR